AFTSTSPSRLTMRLKVEGLSSSVFIWAIISLSSSTITQESYLIIEVTHHNKYDVIIIYQISSFGVSAREAKL
ncbi:MAG: hypothetical protein ACRD8Z_02205, partial [Nitrososphaeraceae archaeon]